MKAKNSARITTFFLPIFIWSFIGSLCAQEYSIVQLTNNNYADHYAQIDNGQVVWQGYDGNDYEIFLYNGTTVVQLTNNSYDDEDPQIDNGQVVWQGYDGNDYEIFFYDGTIPIQLTNDSYDDYDPQIHNGQVVWSGYIVGSGRDIFLYDGTNLTQFGSYGSDYDPQIHNGQVAWEGHDGHDYEIFLYNGTSVIQLTNYVSRDYNPQIHNGQVVWMGFILGRGYEIFLYDGTTIRGLTYNSYDDVAPQIHNGQVVWYGYYGYEIFLYDGTTITQLGSDSYNDWGPQIHNGQVVWSGDSATASGSDIFLYNGTSVTQLTNYGYNDYQPQIHQGQVVWEGWDSYVSDDYEIFLASPPITISGTIRYENRTFNETGTGDPNVTEFKPVRFAKIEIIRDSDNAVLKTDKTGEDGSYSVEVQYFAFSKFHLKCYAEQQDVNYNIIVRDMAGNGYSKDSESIAISGDTATINLDIPVDSNEGGAFNIFDCLVEGTKKVESLSVSSPPLITVHWQRGYVSGTYYQSNTIYINGSSNDPDEYDDGVILHEYGHFIADKYSYDKSPGGVHSLDNTNQNIRLSWSEGWAGFFSSLCRNDPLLISVYKPDGQWQVFSINIETLDTSHYGSLRDISTGQDTEVAVSAILWDIFDNPNGDDDPLGLGAQYTWNIFDIYITPDMDCVLEDFYQGWFNQNGSDFYKNQINYIFSSRSVFYSTPDFLRGPTFAKIDGSPIPDGTGSLSSVLNISENLPIQNVNVFVDLPHELRSDLSVTLVSPSGTEAILHNHGAPLGGQPEDIFAWYQPPYETIPAEGLDRFEGEDSQGSWTLRVVDDVMGNDGNLSRWKMEIVPASISGYVSLQETAQDNLSTRVTFELRDPGTTTIIANASNDEDPLLAGTQITTDRYGGKYALYNVPVGTYDMTAKGSKWLRHKRTNVVVQPMVTTYANFDLRGGDANDSNSVNIQDLNILKASYGTSEGQEGYDDRADFNNTRSVNILDLNILKSNYGKAGDIVELNIQGDFEIWEDDAPSGWLKPDAYFSTITQEDVNTVSGFGVKQSWVKNDGWASVSWMFRSEPISILPGKEYDLNGFIKGDGNNVVYVGVYYCDESGEYLSWENPEVFQSSSADWREMTYSFISSPSYNFATIVTRTGNDAGDSSAVAYFDSFSLKQFGE
jgi:subtilisin-like proprotein convertase family protein